MRLRTLVSVVAIGSVCMAGCKKKGGSGKAENPPGHDAAPRPAPAEYWKGSIEVPGFPLSIGVVLQEGAGGSPSGTVDIPAQKVVGMALSNVKREGNQLAFQLLPKGAPAGAAAHVSATIDTSGKKATGTFRQGAATLSIALERVGSRAELPQAWKRPQTPKPPFPYESREVLYDNPADKSKLGGTLTYPKGPGPFPAVLLITGSGAQDRDETLFEHKPFAVIADHLTRRGIAVLRVDDRGVGKTTGSPKDATIMTHAGDVEAGVAFLGKQKEIDPKRIGLLGHSEGGIIAPIVASRNRSVAFVISLAGTGLPGSIISPMQMEEILRRGDEKLTEEQIRQLGDQQRKLMVLIQKKADTKALAKQIRASYDAVKALGIDAPHATMSAAQLDATAKAEAAKVGSPWFRSFVTIDPAKYWAKVKVPVLALNGSLDTQVPAKPNLAAIEKALAKGSNRDVTLKELAGLNHLFQSAKTGLLPEYAELSETFSLPALELIATWITSKTKK